ncbi:hypothetical protein K1T35_47975 (plasmid) [Pseudonocardia sp. DSM 110487]|uniref:hypothetical protein n=1 Tax=Pseudonocardia sp. DSM 110487 TaxID=2865833 RepID=UPI001C69613B|nr:hypothetical protein [Pseudonocardia sp. DSM 110487]QYN41090.1 hypothetical protein K1T35_47975 [Pseudonocardia sp. DSM 110487]
MKARAARAARAGQPVADRPVEGRPVRRDVDDETELYAERLLHISKLIVGAVHDDGPDMERKHLRAAFRLEPPSGIDPVEALVTILAAQIDPKATTEQRLGWVRRFGSAPTPLTRVPDPCQDRALSSLRSSEENAA